MEIVDKRDDKRVSVSSVKIGGVFRSGELWYMKVYNAIESSIYCVNLDTGRILPAFESTMMVDYPYDVTLTIDK